MEFREILKIFCKHQQIFLVVLIAFVVGGWLIFAMQPMRFQTSIMLNVTRKATQKTDAYRYDDFYRLQADERFADTVVRWLGSPNVSDEIIRESKIDRLKMKGSFKAVRLSSQMIQVNYVTTDATSGKKLSQSMRKVIESQIEKLNEEQKEETWFKVLASDPLISMDRISLKLIMFASILLGIFFGAWTVLGVHYFDQKKTNIL